MEKKTIKRTLEGIIVSDKMDKTRVVLVEGMKKHPLYKKYYKSSKKFKAHDGENQYKEGDRVLIEASRPISRDKRWIIKGLVEKK
jgi:small subunit ribosomal protein S17